MSLPPKEKRSGSECAESPADEPRVSDDISGYYYDDAHGYEEYTGEEDEDEIESDER